MLHNHEDDPLNTTEGLKVLTIVLQDGTAGL